MKGRFGGACSPIPEHILFVIGKLVMLWESTDHPGTKAPSKQAREKKPRTNRSSENGVGRGRVSPKGVPRGSLGKG